MSAYIALWMLGVKNRPRAIPQSGKLDRQQMRAAEERALLEPIKRDRDLYLKACADALAALQAAHEEKHFAGDSKEWLAISHLLIAVQTERKSSL